MGIIRYRISYNIDYTAVIATEITLNCCYTIKRFSCCLLYQAENGIIPEQTTAYYLSRKQN